LKRTNVMAPYFANSESCICDAPPQMKLDLLLLFHVYPASFRGGLS
jgi:hypothetical protein